MTQESLEEKTLTPNELDKREEIVKSLKKKKSDFVKRYGQERAASVMYATATKVAKAVTEELDEVAGTTPTTKKDKELAAHAEPKNLITHKDILVGRGVFKKMQREHLELTGELLSLNQIEESDSAIDGSEKGPISRASAKHGRIKPMSGTKTIATKIATILSKKV